MTDILNKDGSIKVIKWTKQGKTFTFVKAESTGRDVYKTIDSIKCIETGEITKATRQNLRNVKVNPF